MSQQNFENTNWEKLIADDVDVMPAVAAYINRQFFCQRCSNGMPLRFVESAHPIAVKSKLVCIFCGYSREI